MSEPHHGEHHGKSGLEEFLNEDIGGIPAWVVGLGLGALVVLFLILRHRQAPTSSATSSPIAAQPASSPVEEGQGRASGEVGLTPQGLPGPVTDTQWARLSGDFLLSKGDDPTLVNNALYRYLHRQRLTAGQEAIIRLALQTFGEPPGKELPVLGPDDGRKNPTDTKVTVPNVEGEEAPAAKEKLQDAGLRVRFATPEEGIVAFQSPIPGSRVKKGDTVTLHTAGTESRTSDTDSGGSEA